MNHTLEIILTFLGFAAALFIIMVIAVLILVKRDKDLYGDLNMFNNKTEHHD